MNLVSLSEDKNFEKRIAVTPEIAKKYINLGFNLYLPSNYGNHLGFSDDDYKNLGVNVLDDEKKLISNANLIIQLNLPNDQKLSFLNENQTLIGSLNYSQNKKKLEDLKLKKINSFSLELLPRITRAQSMDILSSQANLAGYKAVIEAFKIYEKAIPMMMTAAGTIPAAKVLVVGAGYLIGGIRSALVVCALTLFIALSPWWDRALVTTYMATFGVIISCIIGFTVGTLCFQNKNSAKFMLGVCDIFQTFPSFVYLIPVMMLFGITDTSVLIAVIVYATIPATRYTIEGLRSVPAGLHDAATMSGVNKFQRLTKIEFPLAFPHMMLGLNQTIVFALFMVIIGAFIGTEDLGQYILKALSDKNGAGIGLTLGICVAFIGLIFDNLIRTYVGKRKKHLGID